MAQAPLWSAFGCGSALPRQQEPIDVCRREAIEPGWRTPLVVLICGCLISMVSFGPRSALGFFLTPMSQEHHWGRDVFSMALAIQNLLWGIGQPFAGGIADKFGADRVLMAAQLFYAVGLALMAYSTTPACSISQPAC